MSSGTSAMGHTLSSQINARRDRRHTIAVPVDVVALRSGVPASIPGRTVNVSAGGLAMVFAGELSPGESVGVQFRLAAQDDPIQAKAVVRHYSLMQCGLQFLAMPPEQETALRTWAQMVDRTAVISTFPSKTVTARQLTSAKKKPAQSQSRGLRWAVMSAAVAILVLSVTAWWAWNSGWHDLEHGDAGRSSPAALEVSSSLMGQRIIHRADPIYPSEALAQKIEGEVMLDTLIGEDGTVKDVRAVSGPDLLRPAAMDAVKWWRFDPYTVNGRAVQVHTFIEVDFRLRR